MDTSQKIVYGSIGILSLIIIALGGTIYLTPDQLDHAYICTTNQNIIIADYLSSTLKTAYWTDDHGIAKSKICTNGLWTSLKKYAKENNIAINILLNNQESESQNLVSTGLQYRCNQEKCEVI